MANSKATLYELTEDYLALLEMAEDEEIDEEVFRDTMEGIVGSIEDKADGYAKIMRMLDGQVATIDAEAKRLEARKKGLQRNIDRMKRNLEDAMLRCGARKMKTALFSFSIQKNPPSVEITVDEEHVPALYRVPQPDKIDKRHILEDLKNGALFAWARLTQTESLRIR